MRYRQKRKANYLTIFNQETWNDLERLLARETGYAYGTWAILGNSTACIDRQRSNRKSLGRRHKKGAKVYVTVSVCKCEVYNEDYGEGVAYWQLQCDKCYLSSTI